MEPLPTRKIDREVGIGYLYRDEIRIWDGKHLKCKHNKIMNICSDCGGSQICKHNKRKSRCHECNGKKPYIRGTPIYITHPKISLELHETKNDKITYRGNLVDAKNLPAGSNFTVWWRCKNISKTPCNHEWPAPVSNRCRDKDPSGCPFCAPNSCLHSDGHNSMRNTNEKLTRTFHPTKNAPKTPDNIVAGHTKKLFWKCDKCDNVWKAKGSTRLKEGASGCGFCESGYCHSDGRNIFGLCGDKSLIEEWHPKKNGDLTPFHILDGAGDEVWWQCSKCPNEWSTRLVERVNGRGCKSCIRGDLNSSGTNSLAYLDPILSTEFSLDKNYPLTPEDLTLGNSTENIWWKCKTISETPCGYEWLTTVGSRASPRKDMASRGTGCPSCATSGYDPSKIGYLYIHQYSDGIINWLKCGITNFPQQRYRRLKWSAEKSNIGITELDIYRFDDGYNALNCEKELLKQNKYKFDSGYDIEGKKEFFTAESLEIIIKIVNQWL